MLPTDTYSSDTFYEYFLTIFPFSRFQENKKNDWLIEAIEKIAENSFNLIKKSIKLFEDQGRVRELLLNSEKASTFSTSE